MANSLRDQLLKAGLKSQAANAPRKTKTRKSARDDQRRKRGGAKAAGADAAGGAEMDLARAYALRARSDADERRREKAEAERQAEARRERKRKLRETLSGQALNKADAELMRHFEYGGKIRRVHVNAAQLAQLNAGELAVVQQSGRYLLVTPEIAQKVRAFAPDHVALQVEPGSSGVDEDGVPDDLVW